MIHFPFDIGTIMPTAGPVYIGDPQAKEVTVTSSTQVHIFQLEQALEHDTIATAILDLKKSNGQQIINPTPSPTAPAIEVNSPPFKLDLSPN